jgi:hypothetical protein
MYDYTVSRSDSGPGLVLPMSRSDMEELPESLREIFLGYIAPLNKAIAVLLQQQMRKDDDEKEEEEQFKHNFKNVISEYMKYYTSIVADIREGEFALLLQKSFSSTQSAQEQSEGEVETQTQALTPIEQTLNNALEVTAKATRLMLEPACHDHVLKHPDAWEPCTELMAYGAILNYIQQAETNTNNDIEQSVVEKIIQKCQETTRNVEGFVDTFQIDLDPELSAALERFAAR